MRSPSIARAIALAYAALLASCHPAAPADPPASPAPAAAPPRALAVATSPRAHAFPERPTKAAAAVPPPLSLTASDGSGLRLVELVASAVVDDPLAVTELRLAFDNPEDRTREGTFSITLPEGAAIARFAMKVGGAWQEAEIVESRRAREAYEDFLHRRQDPALLEHAAGNQFAARVFPIPPRGRKELVVTFTEELSRDRGYALPLRGLPAIDRLRVTVTREGEAAPVVALAEERSTPKDDVRVAIGAAGVLRARRSGTLAVARVAPVTTPSPDPIGPTIVLVDTSASRALGLEASVAAVARVARAVAASAGAGAALSVAAFDQEVAPIFDGAAGAYGAAEAAALRAREALGASDLARAIAFAGERATARGLSRVVVVGDGVATAGATEVPALREAAARLREAGVGRIDAIVDGGVRDEAALRAIVTAGLARDGVVVDASVDDATLARRLGEATRSGVRVEVEGASWSWPATLDGVQAGDEAIVYAHVREGAPLAVTVGGARQELVLGPAARPLLERAVARAKIASLLATPAGEEGRDDVRRQVIAISQRYRVPSPFTSLLVLETDRDYERFGIARGAAPDLVTVERGRVALARRAPPPREGTVTRARVPRERMSVAATPAVRPPPSPAADAPAARGNLWGDATGEAFGAGGLGLTGVGEGGGGRGEGIGLGAVGTVGRGAGVGAAPPAARAPTGAVVVGGASVSGGSVGGQGFGAGHGRLGGSHRVADAPPPVVRMGATSVSGRVPPEVIHRVIRARMPALRRCADAAAAALAPSARLSVRFTIGASGRVLRAEVVGGPPDGVLPSCVLAVVRGLAFPELDGGEVTVTYPFVFDMDGATPAPAAAPPPEDPIAIAHPSPYTGRFAGVMSDLARGAVAGALASATAWHREAPGDVMALLALGEALEASGATATAARAYGSLVDLFPARADLRRHAGQRLDRLGSASARAAAVDTYDKAATLRPDHPSGHRLLAYARLRAGDPAGAFDALERGLRERTPNGRFAGVRQVLLEDLGLLGAAWIKADPPRREEVLGRLAAAGARLEDAPSLRFVLAWETDANDVDLHVRDAEGGHAYYSSKALPSGGALVADVTTGYGPEAFVVRGPRAARSRRYALEAHYYARGPMGYGMGTLAIVEHDGEGGLAFEERPFVVMRDKAWVDLGAVER